MKIKEIYGNTGYLAAKSCKLLHRFFLQIYGRHFESEAMNGTCFQDPIEFIKVSISPEFVPLLMDKDLLLKIFVWLRGIKQELYAKSFQANDIRENLPPHFENARRKPQTWRERLVTWLPAFRGSQVRGKLGSKTLYSREPRTSRSHVTRALPLGSRLYG